jgi:FtsZ-interacting cell division protein ZipA
LSIRTAEFEPAQFEDLPMTAQSDPLEATFDLGVHEREAAARHSIRVPTLRMNDVVPVVAPDASSAAFADVLGNVEFAPEAPAVAPVPAPALAPEARAPGPNAAEAQRIVGVRVCAPGDARWTGADLIGALEQQGLTHGRYQVFHRRHSDGRTLFCAASLVEPGTFDIARMPEEEFRGLTLFAVLPGPGEPVRTLESMIATAAALAQTLQGVVQDAKGAPLSQQRAEALRDDVARFQSQLTMH